MITPINKRVLVTRTKADNRTKEGLYIPDSAETKKSTGEVIAVASDITSIIKVGDTVVLPQYGGVDITHEDITYLLISEEDVLGIITE